MEGVIAVFIPIIGILVTGLILVSYFYFRSKEKQMMMDKGLSYEQMMELLRVKTDHLLTLKAGIIIAFFGIGLGIGFLIRDYSYNEDWMAFSIITMTGIGFVVAYFVARAIKNHDEKK
jgi:high-affinity Fe2+/Pb2+ permease